MSVEAFLVPGARWHVIGVGGAGMSGIARVLVDLGAVVSGSDQRHSAVLDDLEALGIQVTVGHEATNVPDEGAVIASPAVATTNPELVAARAAGLAVVRRGDLLAALVRIRPTVAIAGTHGKTTTSTMATLIAEAAGQEPSFLIGETVRGLGVNARWASGERLILEADESYGTFTTMAPAVLAITNVEPDHLDYYGDEATLRAAFVDLARRSGVVVVFDDDDGARAVGRAVGAATVGTAPTCTYSIADVATDLTSSTFTLAIPDAAPLRLTVNASGHHNVANAAVAAAAALLSGAPGAAVVDGLARFGGVPRRFEFRGRAGGVTCIDDYAHLPAEVAATVTAARAGTTGPLLVVFQPHRFTRTAAVGAAFAESFAGADHLLVAPLYSAGEAPIDGVSSAIVANAVRGSGTVPIVEDVDDADLLDRIVALAVEGTVVLTLGAGDLTELPTHLLERLATR